jgi:hypothetical protein
MDFCRRLINNSRGFNQVETIFGNALDALMEQMREQMQEGRLPSHRSLEEHIDEIFGTIDSIHMDIRDPETLLHILRTNHRDLYNQLFCCTVMAIKTIIQQFSEDGKFPIPPIIIGQPFIIIFQNLYPEKFNIGVFKANLQNIPYYKEKLAVKQNTNAFLLMAARVFCTPEHYSLIETVLLAM